MYFLANLGEWDAFEDPGRAALKHVITYLGFGTWSRFIRTVQLWQAYFAKSPLPDSTCAVAPGLTC